VINDKTSDIKRNRGSTWAIHWFARGLNWARFGCFLSKKKGRCRGELAEE
jgi:hypothetical protein